MEAVQRTFNGLDLISHSRCLFLNKVQRNTIILGCRFRKGVAGEGGEGWFSNGGALPQADGEVGRGKRSPWAGSDARRLLWMRRSPNKPSPPALARTSRGKPRPRDRRPREASTPGLPQGRCGISSAPALPRRARSPPRPSCLRQARGLSSGLARAAVPASPRAPLPTCPRALPVTSWKHAFPLPPPRRPGRRRRLRAAAGRGQRRLLPLASAAVSRARRSRRRSRSWVFPARRSEAEPGPALHAGCRSCRAPSCLAAACGAPLPGGHGGGARRAVGAELRWVSAVGMGRGGLAGRGPAGLAEVAASLLERCGTSQGSAGRGGPGAQAANSAGEKSVALAPRKRLHARLAARAAAVGAAPHPAESLQPPPAALGVSGRAVTAPRGCSAATANLDTFPAPGGCCFFWQGFIFLPVRSMWHRDGASSRWDGTRRAAAAPGMGWSSSPRGCGLWGIARRLAGCEICGTSEISTQSVVLCAHVK